MYSQSRITGRVCRLVATVTAGIALSSIAPLSFGYSYDPMFGTGENVLHVTVHFADLNVSRPEGAAALYSRIRSAAKQVCWREQTRSIDATRQLDACIAAAITEAVNTVNQPALFAVLSAKRATSPSARLDSQSRQ